ncbi:IS3 family transposase, partial [candidate division KSB1 bacterium]|nr:IS3 family transposase [candidate division KSB1 bacterium]
YSRDQAISEIFEYIEIYYNRQRIHSTNNFQTPISLNSQRKVA